MRNEPWVEEEATTIQMKMRGRLGLLEWAEEESELLAGREIKEKGWSYWMNWRWMSGKFVFGKLLKNVG